MTARQAASNAAYVARVLDVLREGPSTIGAAKKRTGMGSTQLLDVLSHLLAAGAVTRTNAPTRGRPTHVYTLLREPADPGAATIRRYKKPVPVTPEEEDRYEGASGTFTFPTSPSAETVECVATAAPVPLASCIDRFVEATATGADNPCNLCPTGRARRANYAGVDYEECDDE